MDFTNKTVKEIKVKGELHCYLVTEEGSDFTCGTTRSSITQTMQK